MSTDVVDFMATDAEDITSWLTIGDSLPKPDVYKL